MTGLKTSARSDSRTMDVADLLHWVYRDQKAHVASRGGIALAEGMLSGGGSMTGKLVAQLGLGCFVAGGGIGNPTLHPVAEAVDHHVTNGMDRRHGGLLKRYAISATLPQGHDLELRWEPVWKGLPNYDPDTGLPRRGSFLMHYERKMPVYCYVQIDHDERFVAEQRIEFLEWLDALCALRAWCTEYAGSLMQGWTIKGPGLRLPTWAAEPKWHDCFPVVLRERA